MGIQNSRGGTPIAGDTQQDVKIKVEEAGIQQLEEQKILARKQAFGFNYDNLPKHSELSITKNMQAKIVKLTITVDFVHSDKMASFVDLLTETSKFFKLIRNVELRLIAPMSHESPEIYGVRVWNMMRMINCLNRFDLDEFQCVVVLDHADSFPQMKLAAAVFGLDFEGWTMVTEILGVEGQCNVDLDYQTLWGRRLALLYKIDNLPYKNCHTDRPLRVKLAGVELI